MANILENCSVNVYLVPTNLRGDPRFKGTRLPREGKLKDLVKLLWILLGVLENFEGQLALTPMSDKVSVVP